MAKLNLFVPQWQDSGHSDEVFHGSHAVKELILNREDPEKTFTIGGGCGVDVPIVSHLIRRHGQVQLWWFDAHGDINSPEGSPSGYFHGMALRFLLERFPNNGISELVERSVPHSQVVLLGTRDLDEPERLYIEDNDIRLLSPDACDGDASQVGDLLDTAQGGTVYIHVDLDVIDPEEYRNVKCPAKGGIAIARVAGLIAEIKKRCTVVGISLLENMETNERQLEKLRPILDVAFDL
jgi:arginase